MNNDDLNDYFTESSDISDADWHFKKIYTIYLPAAEQDEDIVHLSKLIHQISDRSLSDLSSIEIANLRTTISRLIPGRAVDKFFKYINNSKDFDLGEEFKNFTKNEQNLIFEIILKSMVLVYSYGIKEEQQQYIKNLIMTYHLFLKPSNECTIL